MPLTGGDNAGGLIVRPTTVAPFTRWAALRAIIEDLRSDDWPVTGTGTLSVEAEVQQVDHRVEDDDGAPD